MGAVTVNRGSQHIRGAQGEDVVADRLLILQAALEGVPAYLEGITLALPQNVCT